MGIYRILNLDELPRILERQTENIGLHVTRNDVVHILRIQVTEFLNRNAGQVLNLLEMKHPADLESIQMCRHLHRVRRNAMLLVICKRIHGAHERRNISPCLTRKILIHRPEILVAATTLYRLVHIARTAVVR